MTKTYLAIAIALAGAAFAELPPPDLDPQIPPDKGYSHVTDGRFPKTLSHDERWLVHEFSIIDNKSGQVAFKWTPPGGEVARESMTVRWSPDSRRVVLIDQGGRAPEFFAAQLNGDSWVNVAEYNGLTGPHESRNTRVTKVQVLGWISPTSL